jgi:hypothetical protein
LGLGLGVPKREADVCMDEILTWTLYYFVIFAVPVIQRIKGYILRFLFFVFLEKASKPLPCHLAPEGNEPQEKKQS